MTSGEQPAALEPREATVDDARHIHRVAWESFLEAIAPLYSEQGVQEYRSFSAPEAIAQRMLDGSRFWILGIEEQAAIAEVRKPNHLAMLFVHPSAQRQGLGSRLLVHLMKVSGAPMTVSSAPGAVAFYAAHGFEASDAEQESGGIRYLPMRWPG